MDMKNLKLTDGNWSYGSYLRKDYKKDTIYTFYQYKEFEAIFSMKTGKVRVSDSLAEQMLRDRLISPELKEAYDRKVSQMLIPVDRLDHLTQEQIYGKILKMRRSVLGAAALEREQCLKLQRGCRFDPAGGIDQRAKKDALLQSAEAVILLICRQELFSLMRQDLEAIRGQGKEIYLIVSGERGGDIPSEEVLQSYLNDCPGIQAQRFHFLKMEEEDMGCNLAGISWDERLQKKIDEGKAVLFVYGEEGLLHCKNLLTEAIVYGIPADYHTKALTNQLGGSRACVVYIPKHFCITDWVRLTERTRISYWQLAQLWEAYGDEIYSYSPQELYQKYPQCFLNIYDTGNDCAAVGKGYPIEVLWPDLQGDSFVEDGAVSGESIMRQYDFLRDQAIKEYLNSHENLNYYSAYFDEKLEEAKIPWSEEGQQGGILVQGIRVGGAKKSGVMNCKEGTTPRQMVQEMWEKEDQQENALKLLSNFLFFLTHKLARLYNELREDRPREQIDFTKIHLDYMLCYKEGKRIETFPLFRKACIARKRDGQFLFFNYRLGGGRLEVSGWSLSWKDTEVDMSSDRVRIYTPHASMADQDADRGTYCKIVGEERLNLVIIQDRIHCIRKGSVILPSIGVVVSLGAELEESFLKETGITCLEEGYYECGGLELTVELDGPSKVPKDQWEQVEWAYGGGLSLILDGKGLDDEEVHAEQWFREEGWMSPLSRQTQESALHEMVKHPRTAIGITKSGELVSLVFSGRIRLSSGADYYEMCRITRQLIPDIWCLMNVDGGGSAMLGMAWGGIFMELSCPATSVDSCVGMVRPVNTVLYLEV